MYTCIYIYIYMYTLIHSYMFIRLYYSGTVSRVQCGAPVVATSSVREASTALKEAQGVRLPRLSLYIYMDRYLLQSIRDTFDLLT